METASQYFGAMVEQYDSLLDRAVPRYREMIERTVSYVPPGKQRILELGCGTGNLTLALARRFPEARLTLVDGSAEMLECAAARLGNRAVECVEARFEDLALEPGSFDLVTSSISLHHVRDMPGLLGRLFGLTAPAGHLVYADQMAGGTARNSELNWGRMVEYWRLPGHLTEQEQQSLTQHRDEHDHYVSVPAQLRWLAEAGFEEPDCVWRNWMWGVLMGRRPARAGTTTSA